MKVRAALIAVAVMVTTGSSPAADWPQWQGPRRDAKSADTGLLKQWPQGGPPLAWKIDKLGGGDGGPAIAAGRIYLMSNRGAEEVVWARSEKDGSEIWVTPLGPAFRQSASQGREGPSCTPTVDGERLYVEGLAGNVACLQANDGKVIWRRSLTEDFGGRVPMWSYRESPLIDGDKVIVTPGGADAIMVALNKLTGETVWKAGLPRHSGVRFWSTCWLWRWSRWFRRGRSRFRCGGHRGEGSGLVHERALGHERFLLQAPQRQVPRKALLR